MAGRRTSLAPHLEDVVGVALFVAAADCVARANVSAAGADVAAGDRQEWWRRQGRRCLDWTVQAIPASAVHLDLPRTSLDKIMRHLRRGVTQGRQFGRGLHAGRPVVVTAPKVRSADDGGRPPWTSC